MIDFHAHILPEIDDGSKSVEQSLQMLEMLANQGVDTVFATPHFYADVQTIDEFLKLRDESAKKLAKATKGGNYPEVKLGAEVLLNYELMTMENLDKLCIEGTNLLLLEMPYSVWSLSHLNCINQILASYNIVPVIAHIDRYLYTHNPELINALLDMEVMIQCNADSLARITTRRKVLRMVKKGQIHFIGSDCHNTTNRKPNIDKALKVLKRHVGSKHMKFFTDDIEMI